MLKQQINDDLKVAMLSGDKPLVAILRDVKSAILNKEVSEKKRDSGLDDAEIVAVLKKEKKSRKESLEVYEKAGEAARADLEKYQMEVIERYLPEEMGQEELSALIDKTIQELGGNDLSLKDMGKVIGTVKQQANNVDGALLAKLVKEKIEG